MKKIICFVLTVLIILTLTACNSKKDNDHEHRWKLATLDEPKTCLDCGETEGDPITIDEAELVYLNNSDAYSIGENNKFITLITNNSNPVILKFEVKDLNNETLVCKAFDFEYENYWHCTLGINENCAAIYIVDNKAICLDWDLNKINEFDTGFSNLKERLIAWKTDDSNIVKIYEKNNKDNYKYFNIMTGECQNDYEPAAPDYDEDIWSYYEFNENFEYYFVGTADGETWGYLDKNGNELAMYADATDFSSLGYAFVSEDRVTYDLIDKDFNVIKKDVATGTSSFVSGDVFFVIHGEKEYSRFIIE